MLTGYTLSVMMTQGAMTWAPTYARTTLGLSPAAVGATRGVAVALGRIVGTIGLGLIVDALFARGRRDAALLVFAAMALVVPPLAALASQRKAPY